MEACRLPGMHVDAFLQQTQPDVAVLVFADGIDLGSVEVNIAAIIGIVCQCACVGVVYGQPHAVIAQHDVALVVDIQHGDVLVASLVNMDGDIAVQAVEPCIGRSDEDTALAVLADVLHCILMLVVI